MPKVKPHAALLASPGMGHIIPVMELGKRMVTHHDFHVTLFVVGIDHASASLLKSPKPNNFDIVALPSVDISGLLDPNARIVAKLLMTMRESLPSLRSAIAAMKFRPTALVVDLFGADAFAIADEFGMLRYLFDTSTAWLLAVTLYSSSNDKRVLYSSSNDKRVIFNDHVKGKRPLEVPGCKPLRFEDTLDSLINIFDGFQILGTGLTKIDGILINTWDDLDPQPLKHLGMMITWGESLSGGALSAKQITELAWGLEQSQQRFICVVRPPAGNATGDYFTIGKNEREDDTPDYLPEGFFTRTKDIGLVIPRWAPQAQILSHPSVGGFLSHCGWNSTLESISNGVPMIAWPLYADQKMNAAMLTEDWGIAVQPKVSPTEGIIGRVEVEKMVRKIMVDKEGHAMRNRVKELNNSPQKALSKGGSSYNFLSQVAKVCLQRLQP
ncbi:hypothetical protein DITRI_Ditri18aG0102600 [Diplodiscus trichospermus]